MGLAFFDKLDWATLVANVWVASPVARESEIAMWDEKTLYTDHPVFGIGMSGWHKDELHEANERLLLETFCYNRHMLELIEIDPEDKF